MSTKNYTYILIPFLSLILFSCSDSKIDSPTSECPAVVMVTNSDEYPNDAIQINSISVQDQELNINVSHGGGCEEHEYVLLQDPLFCGTPPVHVTIRLDHNSNEDMCEALITKDLCFDLSSIYESFPNDTITIGLYNTHQPSVNWVIEP